MDIGFLLFAVNHHLGTLLTGVIKQGYQSDVNMII
jgi:hypothetical protein